MDKRGEWIQMDGNTSSLRFGRRGEYRSRSQRQVNRFMNHTRPVSAIGV